MNNFVSSLSVEDGSYKKVLIESFNGIIADLQAAAAQLRRPFRPNTEAGNNTKQTFDAKCWLAALTFSKPGTLRVSA